MMLRTAMNLIRQNVFWLLWVWLALFSSQGFAQTRVTNAAVIAPPPGLGECLGAAQPCTGNNRSEVTVDVGSIVTSKGASPASGSIVVPGSQITYTLAVTVRTATTTAPIELTDSLGAGVTYAGLVGNQASDFVVTPNNNGSRVSVAKALTGESINRNNIAEPGEDLTYTLTLSNPSSVAVTTSLTDDLGAGLTYKSSTGGTNNGSKTVWGNLTVPAASGAAPGTTTVTVTATVVTPITATVLRNVSYSTGDNTPPSTTTPCVAGDARCVETPTASAVTVSKSSDPARGATVVAGQIIRYTLTVTVAGGAGTTAPTVFNDALGAGLSFIAMDTPNAAGFTQGGSGNAITFTLPTNKPAGTYTVSYTARVAADAGQAKPVTNLVTSATAVCVSAPDCTTSHQVGRVSVAKALTGESINRNNIAEPGEDLTYTLTLSNP
ncbi:MAG: isopeptide-forming domain-containing fimbrial protein, partial [Comamonadaceae bacterium]